MNIKGLIIFTIIFVLCSSCASTVNPRNTEIELDTTSYVHPFIRDFPVGTIFLYNPANSPSLTEIYGPSWSKNVPRVKENPNSVFYESSPGPVVGSYAEVSWGGAKAFADAVFVNGRFDLSNSVSISINVSQGIISGILPGHRLIFYDWKETDPKGFQSFKDILYARKGNQEGEFIILEQIEKATVGQFVANFSDNISGSIKESVVEKVELTGGYITNTKMVINASDQNPWPYKRRFAKINLDAF